MSKFVSKIFTRYNIIESQTFIFQSGGSFQFFTIYIYSFHDIFSLAIDGFIDKEIITR